MLDIKDLTLDQLKVFLEAHGAKGFLAAEIWSWIYQKGAENFDQMSNLALSLRKALGANFYILGLKPVKSLCSFDGTLQA